MPEEEFEDEDTEVVFAAMKEEIVGVTKAVMTEICDDKGNILKQNISTEEMKALANLQKRVNEGQERAPLSHHQGGLCGGHAAPRGLGYHH